MGILVNPHTEHEEKVLIAFLNSMKYDYKPNFDTEKEAVTEAFLDQYNKDIDAAEAEIEAGDYLDQAEVEKLFANRIKKPDEN